jgi:hypothetical protein
VVGAHIRQYFTYLPSLLGLLALLGTYVEEWVREFFASVWVAPDHSYIHYALADTDYRVIAQRAKESLGLIAYATRIHELCYGNFEPPRQPHGGALPPLTLLHHVFISLLVRAPTGQWAILHTQLGSSTL